jgi:CelD/BcsL family acetyltransferase involved in cellulose biosynthesis
MRNAEGSLLVATRSAALALPAEALVAKVETSPALRGPMTAKVLERRDEIEAVTADWQRLAERCGNFFVTPQWTDAWLSTFPSERPFVIAVRDEEGRLRGVLPMTLAAGRLRTLRFAGAALGDDFHPAATPADGSEVAEAAATAIRERRSQWSLVAFDNVNADDPWRDRVGQGLNTFVRRAEGHLEVALNGTTWEEYLAGRSRNFRQALRRNERLADDQAVRYRRTTSPEALDQDLTTFFALHDQRWARRGTSTLAAPRARDFVRRFAHTALAAGWLRLWFLELDGRAVAAWLGWRLGDRYSYYQSGRDPTVARPSVGYLLMARTIREACDEHAAVYDMLAGTESYKRRFATSEHETVTVLLSRRLHPANVLAAAEVGLRRASLTLPPRIRGRVHQGARRLLDKLPATRPE